MRYFTPGVPWVVWMLLYSWCKMKQRQVSAGHTVCFMFLGQCGASDWKDEDEHPEGFGAKVRLHTHTTSHISLTWCPTIGRVLLNVKAAPSRTTLCGNGAEVVFGQCVQVTLCLHGFTGTGHTRGAVVRHTPFCRSCCAADRAGSRAL